MTDPIVLADAEARAQFRDTARVVVFRAEPRETGRTAWRSRPDGPERGEALVSEVGVVDPDSDASLRSYRPLSGFSTLAAWRDAMRDDGGDLPAEGYLYYAARPPDAPSIEE